MRQHLVYLAAPARLKDVAAGLRRFGARLIGSQEPVVSRFELTHKLLGELVLDISLISDIDGVTVQLRRNPVDLLIYDETGPQGVDAIKGINKIKKDVTTLAEKWGPDFLFPMSRVVALLNDSEGHAHRAFDLGRLSLRDVKVLEKNNTRFLLWLKQILYKGVIRANHVGYAFSGGGLEGFLYQLGVIYALRLAAGADLTDQATAVSGISSGGIAGSLIAAKSDVAEMIRAVHKKSKILPPLESSTLFDFAAGDIVTRMIKQSTVWAGLQPQKWLDKTMRSIPSGFFKGDRLENYIRECIEAWGASDRFEDLEMKLFIGATDQDSFDHVVFGRPPWSHVPISEALRASAGLPPFFMPKEINGRMYIDGQVTKTCNIEVLIEHGCRLIIIIDPMKPFASISPGYTNAEGGFYGVVQTIKALTSSRFESSLVHLSERYPDVDFMVFQPDEECAKLMAGSPMKFRIRTQIVESAYVSTLRKLRDRHHIVSETLGRYGFRLKAQNALQSLEESYEMVLGEA